MTPMVPKSYTYYRYFVSPYPTLVRIQDPVNATKVVTYSQSSPYKNAWIINSVEKVAINTAAFGGRRHQERRHESCCEKLYVHMAPI
jgi:hypothetical protein